MWDLAPWLGIKTGPLALGLWCLSHWTTREVQRCVLSILSLRSSQSNWGHLSDIYSSSWFCKRKHGQAGSNRGTSEKEVIHSRRLRVEVETRGSDILEGFKSQVRSSLGNWQREEGCASPSSLCPEGWEVRQEAERVFFSGPWELRLTSRGQVVKSCLAHPPISFNPVGSEGLSKGWRMRSDSWFLRKRQLCGAG